MDTFRAVMLTLAVLLIGTALVLPLPAPIGQALKVTGVVLAAVNLVLILSGS